MFLWIGLSKNITEKQILIRKLLLTATLLSGYKDTSNNKSFECIKIDYGIGNNAPTHFYLLQILKTSINTQLFLIEFLF